MNSFRPFRDTPAAPDAAPRRRTAPATRVAPFCAVLVALLVAACDDNASRPDSTTPPAPSWRQLAGGVGERQFRSAWGASADTIYATGTDHPLLESFGGVWSIAPLPAQAILSTLWGASTHDIFVVGLSGAAFHFDGQAWSQISADANIDFLDLWGTGTHDLFACATNDLTGGFEVHCRRDGSWARIDGEFPGELHTIWAASPQAIYVAGDDAYIGRFDGVVWKPISKLSGFAWLDAWGASASDAFFVGDTGHIGRYSAGTLREMTSPTTATLRSIFGFSADNIFAVGDGGTIVHFDGTAWSTMAGGTQRNLYSVWGFGDGRAVALGDFGVVLLFDGTTWRLTFDGQPPTFEDAFGFSADDVFFAGRTELDGVVRHLDGREWTFPGERLLSVWGFAPDDVFVSGEFGVLRHFDGMSWTKLASGSLSHLAGVCGAEGNGSRRVFAVGVHGTIRYSDDPLHSAWTPMIPPSDGLFDLRGIWAAAPGAAFAVGPTGTILRFDDAESIHWFAEDTGTGTGLAAIAGRSADDVVAVSDDGRLFHFNGRTWTVIPIQPTGPLRDVSYSPRGAILAVSSRPRTATLIEFRQYLALETPYLGRLSCGWVTDGTAYVAGGEGAILKYLW